MFYKLIQLSKTVEMIHEVDAYSTFLGKAQESYFIDRKKQFTNSLVTNQRKRKQQTKYNKKANTEEQETKEKKN